MSRLLLQQALRGGARHVSPFLMLGDPAPDVCVTLCRTLVEAGATMLELGLPYVDPSADGPAVQAAGARARAAGVSTDEALAVLAEVRRACPETPCNLLVYGNLVHARGYERFCRDAVDAGASSLLVPDIPLEEGAGLYRVAREHGLGNVLLAGPRTPDERLRAIAAASDAFVYLAAHQGITGADGVARERAALVQRVRAVIDVPMCVGFGLGTPEDVQDVHEGGAEIAVIGSHLLRVLAHALDRERQPDAVVAAVRTAFEQLKPPSLQSKETPSCS